MRVEDYDLIEKFVEGDLKGQDLVDFQSRLETEKDLADELSLRQSMEDFLAIKKDKDALKNTLSTLNGEFFKEAKKEAVVIPFYKKRGFQFGTVAAVILMILGALFLFPQQTLYEKYLGNPELNLRERSSSEEIDFEKLEKEYEAKNYAFAKSELENYLENHPNDLRAKLARGICLMELGETENAQNIFREIHEGESSYKYSGTWYLALSYLKNGDLEQTKNYLGKIPEGSDLYKIAQKLMAEL